MGHVLRCLQRRAWPSPVAPRAFSLWEPALAMFVCRYAHSKHKHMHTKAHNTGAYIETRTAHTYTYICILISKRGKYQITLQHDNCFFVHTNTTTHTNTLIHCLQHVQSVSNLKLKAVVGFLMLRFGSKYLTTTVSFQFLLCCIFFFISVGVFFL